MQPIQVPLKSILKYLTWIFLATEFASFVAGKIIQVIEAMPGPVVPLAMFSLSLSHVHFHFLMFTISLSLSHFHFHTFTQIVWQLPCCCHAAARFCTHILPHRKRNCRWSSKSRLCWNALQDLNYSFKFGHEMLSLTYLATRWHHLRELQSWPPDGTTRISHKVVHQMAPPA